MNRHDGRKGEFPAQRINLEAIRNRMHPGRTVGNSALRGVGVTQPAPLHEQKTQPIRRHEQGGRVPERLVTSVEAASLAKEDRSDPNINEDSYFANARSEAAGVFDGAGGHAGSDVAAQVAAASVDRYTDGIHGPRPVTVAKGLMRAAMGNAHNEIIRDVPEIEDQENQPTTTGTFVKVFEDGRGRKYAVIASVGDSRAYLRRRGKLSMLTIDQSFGTALVESREEKFAHQYRLSNVTNQNQILPQDKAGYTQRHYIMGSLGPGGGYEDIDINHVYLEPDDEIWITSDGIHDNLTMNEMEQMLARGARPDDLAWEARQRSREYGYHMRAKPDDMTAVKMAFELQ